VKLAEHGVYGLHRGVVGASNLGLGLAVVTDGPLGERNAQDAVVAVIAKPGRVVEDGAA
jgi:hypothetical protein